MRGQSRTANPTRRPGTVTLVGLTVLLALMGLFAAYAVGDSVVDNIARLDESVLDWFVVHRATPWTTAAQVFTGPGGTVSVTLLSLGLAGWLWLRRTGTAAVGSLPPTSPALPSPSAWANGCAARPPSAPRGWRRWPVAP